MGARLSTSTSPPSTALASTGHLLDCGAQSYHLHQPSAIATNSMLFRDRADVISQPQLNLPAKTPVRHFLEAFALPYNARRVGGAPAVF